MIKDFVLKILKLNDIKISLSQLEIPSNPKMGDVSLPCFNLLKDTGENAKNFAENMVKKIKLPEHYIIQKVEAFNGYVNFYFDYVKLSEEILKNPQRNLKSILTQNIMVEYSQPNPIHPMHIGHARNLFLGDSYSNLLEFVGHKVIRANYFNNVGLQVAKLILAYKLWGNNEEPNTKPDLWLWKFYKKFHEEESKDEKLLKETYIILKKYEDNDPETTKLFEKIVGWCIKGFDETYNKLGIKFDVCFYENNYRKLGKDVVLETLEKGISYKTDNGAVFAELGDEIPGTIIQRSDGTGLYMTSDLGLTKYKFSKYNLDKSIWLSHEQQNIHFKRLFKIFELLGYDFYKKCEHFSYEWVDLPEGKMSSRKGTAVMLDEVVEKLINKSYNEIKKRNPDLNEDELKRSAEKIAIGSIKYAILKIEPKQKIIFHWNNILSLEGNNCPYLQYAYTRCENILNKVDNFIKKYSYFELNDQEKKIIKNLSEFESVIESAFNGKKIHLICNYAFNIANNFNSFYTKSSVLKCENLEQRNFRITLVKEVQETLKCIFSILGIEAPNKM